MDEEPSATTALGISLSLASVGMSTCLAWLVADAVGGVPAWPLTGFLVSTAYPLAAGIELAVAERAQGEVRAGAGGPAGGRTGRGEQRRVEAFTRPAPRRAPTAPLDGVSGPRGTGP